ncbi:DUF6011 domain-containing protein [Mycobacterium heckeshornense]|uniref:DUF6011 domain-containing protein n=1 Tax=Mycobacterium heckeshornense TaxID=110505 RepID=UPI0008FD7EAE|nr:DUF6011 domain-containing protein [Mycobacterium heckeshornense]
MNREGRARPGLHGHTTTVTSIRRRQDGYAAPAADERAEQRLLAAARRFGFRLAVQCLDCRRWLVDPASVAAHRGPVCRARAGDGR